jgi:hypothetical protein
MTRTKQSAKMSTGGPAKPVSLVKHVVHAQWANIWQPTLKLDLQVSAHNVIKYL